MSVAASTALIVALTGTAQAASGMVFYKSADGRDHSAIDPADGVCHTLEGIGGVIYALNATDKSVRFYSDQSCGETVVATIPPNESAMFDPAGSMLFAGTR
ncbi:hypothetical protein [Nocardia sp. CDC160]|uniref:hypothetical protein n=1 Tax=Nocardia sp. CDC160 TaxID=3112166 RepID=UPI002DB8BAAF|nr:hypothetical protein [Nocardia sp. CDC160]MEC3919951.1 hypothetical protein [Nocardia sp. CDC160]